MSRVMPGRAVDIVMAAADRAGLQLGTMHIDLYDGELTAHLRFNGPRTQAAAFQILAELGVGVADAQITSRAEYATVAADVPVLGRDLCLMIDPIHDLPTAVDSAGVEALADEVDAARAADAEAATGVGARVADADEDAQELMGESGWGT